jgi:hypothetical protein
MSNRYYCAVGIIGITMLFVLTFDACSTSKTLLTDMEIKEISLYEYYREGGTTTVGAFNILPHYKLKMLKP